MNSLKLTAGALLAGALLTTQFVSPVLADELTQEQRQKLEQELNIELECTTGAYGQPQTCTAKGTGKLTGEQEQRARLVLGSSVFIRDGVLYEHVPVAAGLDQKTTILFAIVLLAGVTAAAYQIKTRLS